MGAMRRERSAERGRYASASRSGATGAPPPRGRPHFRLAALQGALALELEAPVRVGALTVAALSSRLADLTFPLDLSGGVERFRHRRGDLEALTLHAEPDDIARWAAPKLRGLLSVDTPEVTLAWVGDRWSVGLRARGVALAFDVSMIFGEGEATFIASRARGAGLSVPAFVVAARALRMCFGHAEAKGSLAVIRDPARNIAREVFVAAGGRVPRTERLELTTMALEDSRLVLHFEREARAFPIDPGALRAAETARLTARGDDAALANQWSEAREAYARALEQAPHHAALAVRSVESGFALNESPEPLLSMLVEAVPLEQTGVVGARLLSRLRDKPGAAQLLQQVAEREAVGSVSAAFWQEASQLTDDVGEQLRCFDEAIARAPSWTSMRRERARLLSVSGEREGAWAEYLLVERLTVGRTERYGLWVGAGEAFRRDAHEELAARAFERALRFAPRSVIALLGLARCLAETGKRPQAAGLLARALRLADGGETPRGAELQLAELLVELAQDRPAAIARVGQVAVTDPAFTRAKRLEAEWRIALGDVTGGRIVLERLAVQMDVRIRSHEASLNDAVELLAAATLAMEQLLAAPARQLAMLVLRLTPDNVQAQRVLRAVSRIGGDLTTPANDAVVASIPAAPTSMIAARTSAHEDGYAEDEGWDSPEVDATGAGQLGTIDFGALDDAESTPSRDADEALAENLADKVKGDPTNLSLVLELCAVLARLGRDMDLFALVSARWEEGDSEHRAALRPYRADVLQRLATAARAAGRPGEAELYEMMLGQGEP